MHDISFIIKIFNFLVNVTSNHMAAAILQHYWKGALKSSQVISCASMELQSTVLETDC
jgi:hypothetical protein